MRVPAELSDYSFTLMKDTLRAGEIRIAVQRYRQKFFGLSGEMVVDGFVMLSSGCRRDLSQEDRWDLT